MNTPKNKKLLLQTAVLFTFCGILSAGCNNSGNEQVAGSVYATQILAPENRTLATSYSATIRGRQDVEIYPQVSGTITRICVEEGSSVHKGETLFVIDQIPYQAALNTAQANVRAARAGVSTARLTYDSRKELFAENVVSEFDLRVAENELETAQAQLAQMEARELDAANNLSYTVVKSPADGVVGMLPYRVGALVSASSSQPLTTVSDNSEMYVYFSMNENRLLSLTREHGSMKLAIDSMPAVQLQLNDGSLYNKPGRIQSISGVIDRNTGTVTVKAVFPNEGGLLHSGATGNVLLPVEYTGCLVIPQKATYEIQDKHFAYKVVDGKAFSSEIIVSPVNDGQYFIVESGLQPGDTILTEGVSTMREGTPIATENK